MKVWKKRWDVEFVIQPFWINLIIVWLTIPLFFEIVGRMLGVEFFGLIIGLIVSSIKTAYDYIQIKYYK